MLIICSLEPGTFIFFTCVWQNEVWLVSNVTLAGTDNSYSPNAIALHGEDISMHFPRDKFILGLDNGGQIAGLAEHFVRRAVHEGNLDKVKQALDKYSK